MEKEFLNTVEAFTSKIDFEDNSYQLKEIPLYRRASFLNILKFGASIPVAIRASAKIESMSLHGQLTKGDIVNYLPDFRELISILDGK